MLNSNLETNKFNMKILPVDYP